MEDKYLNIGIPADLFYKLKAHIAAEAAKTGKTITVQSLVGPMIEKELNKLLK